MLLGIHKRLNNTIKTQISSTKLQINFKFQYTMTKAKTFTTVQSYRLEKPGLSVMMPMSTTVGRLSVWNFEFGSLKFV
jgi:hypothetical protein